MNETKKIDTMNGEQIKREELEQIAAGVGLATDVFEHAARVREGRFLDFHIFTDEYRNAEAYAVVRNNFQMLRAEAYDEARNILDASFNFERWKNFVKFKEGREVKDIAVEAYIKKYLSDALAC